MRKLLTILAMTAGMAGMAASAQAFSGSTPIATPKSPVVQVNNHCGWYAIFTCDRTESGAQPGAYRYGGYVIYTNDIDGFRNGWWCSVKGPSNKWTAKQNRNAARHQGARTAYIKRGCENNNDY